MSVKSLCLRTSTEIEHAAVEAVVDVLRSELAASQKNHRDEVEDLESTCQLHMVRAQRRRARLKGLQVNAAAEQQARLYDHAADKVEALTLRMELSDVSCQRAALPRPSLLPIWRPSRSVARD